MNVQTITMDPAAAQAKLAEYERALRRRSDTEYERAAAAYAALAEGTPILILSEVIAQAPRDVKGRPMLAVARADRKQVKWYRSWADRRTTERFDTDLQTRRGPMARDAVIDVVTNVPPVDGPYVEGFAMVPLVPPAVARGHVLARCFILWEVEAWADRPLGVQPDRDPYLLTRLAPDCYAVVGEWDLTEVERAVMRGRR